MDVTLLLITRYAMVSNIYLFQYIGLRCINNYTRDIDLSWVVLSRDNWNYKPVSLINPNIQQSYFELQRLDLLIYLSKHDSNYFSIHQVLYNQLILFQRCLNTNIRPYINVNVIILNHCETETTVPIKHFWDHLSSNTDWKSPRSFIRPAKLFAE